MDFSIKLATADAVRADCVAVGLYTDGALTPAAQRIDTASGGAIAAAVRSGDATGKRGTHVLLRGLKGVAAARVLLVGLGKTGELTAAAYAEAVRTAARQAGAGSRDLALAAAEWKPAGRDTAWLARHAVLAARETAFRADELKSRKDDAASVPARVLWLLAERDAEAERGLREGAAIAHGAEVAKRLGNLPPNVCTPTFLANEARRIGRAHGIEVEVHDRAKLEKLGMGSFLSVTRGSAEPPRLIVMKYRGDGDAAPTVLVGKGITFDSGGISLKPGANMDEMKFDMCGAASVIGTLRAIGELKPRLNLIGVVAACENLPSGTATRPGDIVTSMSGQTIEVLNTDAEGRLILCDALTYVERFRPAAVIDIATLTGACVVALGDVNHGLFATDDTLAADLLEAAQAANDAAWRLPVQEEYQDQLKSNFADMANIGAPGKAGAVIAACFLARFTKAYKWAHLDIAGTAWKSGPAKGATGRPVPLLSHYLLARTGSEARRARRPRA